MDSKVLTLRLEPKLIEQLDKLAEATQRSRSFLIAEAVRDYIALNEWQVEKIRHAIAGADRGEFASDDEVKKTFRKRARRAG